MKPGILFIGDSIFEGISGINFVRMLKNNFTDFRCVNRGVGGDTLVGISRRLSRELEAEADNYNVIVFEAGHNDIIIPTFSPKGNLYKLAQARLHIRGSIPTTDPEWFKVLYRETVKDVRKKTNAILVITTLSCISENLHAEPNKKREIYNDIIRTIAREEQVLLADIGHEFDNILKQKETNGFYMDNFLEVSLMDPLSARDKEGADAVSKKRGTHLTIDGVHMNYEGALVYYEKLKEKIEKALYLYEARV